MLNINEYNIDLLNLVDIEKILHQLLSQIRTLTFSDAGTIYLKDEEFLKFCVFQNDSLSSTKINKLEENNKFLKLPLDNRKYIAVKSFQSLAVLKINNIYKEEKLDVSGIKAFDLEFNYKTYSMVTIPLVEVHSKNPIGILQIINKTKNGELVSYSNMDVELIKIASNFISYTISKAIEYKNSLEKIDGVINEVINDEILNKIEFDRLNSFHNKILHTGKVLKDIAHQWRQPLCELSVNNSYLSSKLEDFESNELLIDNQSIIQSLSSIIDDYETAYEHQHDIAFRIFDAFKISYKLINTYIKSYHIKVIKNIDKNVIIYGEKNIFIQVILSILQNSLDAFKVKRIKNPYIEITVKKLEDELILIFEDNAGGIDEKLLFTIFDLLKDSSKIRPNNMTLNMLRIVIREKFNGEILASNTEFGLMITIVIKTNKTLFGVKNG